MSKIRSIQIITSAAETERFVDDARKAGDANKKALGFLPISAYSDFSAQGTLFIAISNDKYAGHLAFGGKFPHIKIWQLTVAEPYRNCGVGRKLFDALVNYATQRNIITLRADVAADLVANHFWDKMGLAVARTRAGKTPNRTINVREKLLSDNDLLSNVSATSISGIRDIEFKPVADKLTCILDLNFLIDALRPNRPLHDDAIKLMAAALRQRVRLYLAPEADVEIQRNAPTSATDPLKTFADALPRIPAVPEASIRARMQTLRSIVFPSKPLSKQLTPQETSDLRHLACCAELRIGRFVTRDRALLAARDSLLRNFEIDVTTPADVIYDVEGAELVGSAPKTADSETRIIVESAGPSRVQALRAEILAASPATSAALETIELTNRNSALVATRDGAPFAVAWVKQRTGAQSESVWSIIFLAPSIDDILIADQFLASIVHSGIGMKETRHEINLFNAGPFVVDHLKSRGCLEGRQFAADPHRLLKFAVNGYVDAETWPKFVETLRSAIDLAPMGFAMPGPSDAQTAQLRKGTGQIVPTTWFELETITGPVLYLFRTDSALLVPINIAFAEELLGSRQGNAFAMQAARLRTERVYFRSARGLKAKQGMPVIFRETKKNGGSGAAIGCARLTHYGIYDTDVARTKFRNRGVIDLDQFERADRKKTVCVLAFDNFQEFTIPVSLKKLHEIKAVTGTQNVTAETIKISIAQKILEMGFRDGK